MDLKDVGSWSFDGKDRLPPHILVGFSDGELTNDGGSSNGALGVFDFDDVQSERLWWIFNSWRDSKENYMNGKTDLSSFRHQNLRTLRSLLDAFDPQQVAVLNINEASGDGGIIVYDVAHIGSHALLEDRNFVLSVGCESQRTSHMPQPRLDFKVFQVSPGRTAQWRHEIPRTDWYLSHSQGDFSTDISGRGSGPMLRTLRLLGAKLLLKLVGALLLENSLVIFGSSFGQVKEVALCLMKLLHPFKWHHTFLPFLPVTSWRFLADVMNHYVQAQMAGRSRTKMSISLTNDWKWGSPRSLVQDGDVEHDVEPPFVIGTTSDAWQSCMHRLRSSSADERSLPAYVNILDLDNPSSFSTAKSSENAVCFPRKWRKQVMERFEKIVKQRRKLQEKMIRKVERQISTSSSQSVISSPSPASVFSRSHHSFNDAVTPLSRGSPATRWVEEEREVYDAECASGFVSSLQEFYDRLCSQSLERAKKRKGKKKKHSKREEIKSWFSSSHEFDAYVERFLDTTIYEQYELDRAQGTVHESRHIGMPRLGSASHSRSSGVFGNGTNGSYPLSATSLGRSFGSLSSTSSSFNGLASHHQQL
ncbi:hypothetical protein PINS_up006928 [Pythium insidiosum]|nr:hypothetical protein PINS_up006928 [Pythium insidiosum]